MFFSKKSKTSAVPNIFLEGTVQRIGATRLDSEWEDNYEVLFEGITEIKSLRLKLDRPHEVARIFALTAAGDSLVVEVHVDKYGKLMVMNVSNLTLGLSSRTVDVPAI